MRLILIRHGETTANIADLLDTALPGAELTDQGRAQAAALPQAVAHLSFAAIVCSGAARTRATAAPLATARGLALGVDERFKEIQAGTGEGSAHPRDWKVYVDTITAWWAGHPEARMPNQESGTEFFSRWDKAIADLAAYDEVAIVTHGGAMRTWTFNRCDNVDIPTAAAPMPNTGYVVVEGEPGAWKVRNWNGRDLDQAPAQRTGAGPAFAATVHR